MSGGFGMFWSFSVPSPEFRAQLTCLQEFSIPLEMGHKKGWRKPRLRISSEAPPMGGECVVVGVWAWGLPHTVSARKSVLPGAPHARCSIFHLPSSNPSGTGSTA